MLLTMQAARFASAPVAAFACVAIGIALGRGAEPLPSVLASLVPSWWFALACGCVAIGAVLSGWRCAAPLAAACVFASAGWSSFRLNEASGATLDVALAHAAPPLGRSLIAVEGEIIRGPERWVARPSPFSVPRFGSDEGAWLVLRVARLGLDDGSMAPARGTMGVAIRGEAEGLGAGLRVGQRVGLSGVFEPRSPTLNPGAGKPVLWAQQSGRAGSIATTAGAIEVLAEPEPWSPRALVDALRQWSKAALPAGDSAAGRVVRAIVLGERDPGDPLQQAFARIGVSHLLAISGFHVGALALGVVWLVRLTGERGGSRSRWCCWRWGCTC